jgi:hypothetical protein
MNDQTSTSRPLNVGYLVVGLVFLGIAGAWALRAGGLVDTSQVQWLVPAVLVGAGVIGLVAFGAKGLGRRRTPRYDEPAAYDEPAPYDLPGHHPTADTAADTAADTEPTTRIEGDDR